MPKTVGCQDRRQAHGITVGLEPGVDLRRLDPAAALGHPQRRVVAAAELRPDVLDIVGDRIHRPAHHRGDVPAARRLAPLGLAVADVQHPTPAELRRGRVPAPVRDVELRVSAIGGFTDHWNEHRVPFAWTNDADEILGKIKCAKTKANVLTDH
jgi:hypothetical protein